VKTLLMMRHAKSSWDDPDTADHERPLNKRGKRDAPHMGEWLAEHGLTPDVIVTSTAKRARKTAELVAEACGCQGELVVRSDLYHATPEVWMQVVRNLPETASRVLCIGHNPAVEEVLAHWTGEVVGMPTAAIAHLALDVETWRDFDGATGVSLRGVQRVKEVSGEE
jgi:phosphohistidine phosphatase